MNILQVENLSKQFGGVKAVKDLSFSVDRGRILGIIGPNGSGKTTVFNLITGFIPKDKGKVILDGADVSNYPFYKIATHGMVRTFQQSHLFKNLSVMENIITAMRHNYGEKILNLFFKPKSVKKETEIMRESSIDLLKNAGIKFDYEKPAYELSFGQQKLLEIVCAVATKPKVLLLDEPTAGVDLTMISKISSLIKELAHSGIAVVIIEHNISFIKELADEVIVIDRGHQIASGVPSDVINNIEVLNAYLGA
jgi:ABC-type branched-subunit amino acid transport system ATPase component